MQPAFHHVFGVSSGGDNPFPGVTFTYNPTYASFMSCRRTNEPGSGSDTSLGWVGSEIGGLESFSYSAPLSTLDYPGVINFLEQQRTTFLSSVSIDRGGVTGYRAEGPLLEPNGVHEKQYSLVEGTRTDSFGGTYSTLDEALIAAEPLVIPLPFSFRLDYKEGNTSGTVGNFYVSFGAQLSSWEVRAQLGGISFDVSYS